MELQEFRAKERDGLCLLTGCRRSAFWNSKCCSNFHFGLYMSRAIDDSFDTFLKVSDVCMLPECGNKVAADSEGVPFNFCCRLHCTFMKELCNDKWQALGRLCLKHGCSRHVYVDNVTKTPYKFCGISHATAGVASTGDTKSTCTWHQIELNHHPSLDEGWGYLPLTISECEFFLKIAANDREHPDLIANRALQRGVNIYNYHPWEIVRGFQPRSFLYYISEEQLSNRRKRTTKEAMNWKQSSKTHSGKKSVVETTYFFYSIENVSPNNVDRDHRSVYSKYQKQKSSKIEGRPIESISKKRRVGQCGPEPTRWKMHELIWKGGSNKEKMQQIPVIWKIFQDEKGLPVYPPLVTSQEELAGRFPSSTDAVAVSSEASCKCNQESPDSRCVHPPLVISQEELAGRFPSSADAVAVSSDASCKCNQAPNSRSLNLPELEKTFANKPMECDTFPSLMFSPFSDSGGYENVLEILGASEVPSLMFSPFSDSGGYENILEFC